MKKLLLIFVGIIIGWCSVFMLWSYSTERNWYDHEISRVIDLLTKIEENTKK